jgi:hypothetical protein
MITSDPQSMLNALVQPWHEAVADPVAAQTKVLENIVPDYAKTGY